MKPGPAFHYETVATAFQVVDIAEPLRTSVPPSHSLEDVWSAIMEDAEDGENWFALIRDEQEIVGYIALDDIPDTGDHRADDPKSLRAGQVCQPITPNRIVPASLPLLDLIPLFEQHYFFFVLAGNDLTHVVSFRDLDQLPVKLCLFALITGFEAECIRLFSQGPITASVHLARLPAKRYQKAVENCQQREPREQPCTPPQVLQATEFIDKTTMLLREPAFVAALPFSTKREAERYFNKLQDLRNRIAHSDSILKVLSTPQSFNELLARLKDLTNRVSELAGGVLDTSPPETSSDA